MEKENQKESRWSRAIKFIVSNGFLKLLALLVVFYVWFTGGNEIVVRLHNLLDISIKNENDSVTQISGEKTIVSKAFSDISQACWFYHDNYKSQHPYTLTWSKKSTEDANYSKIEDANYPKIRVIAESAIWKSRACIRDGVETYLLGDEAVNHTIEAQFAKDRDFVRIATSEATYQSKLFFDPSGRPTVRKVVTDKDGYKCHLLIPINKASSDYTPNQLLSSLRKVCTTKPSPSPSADAREIREVEKKDGEREKQKHINSLIITLDKEHHKNYMRDPSTKYIEALNLYINERKEIHRGLADKGCGAIAFEPELGKTKSRMKPAIAFFCFKDEVGSHVRLMMRE